MSLQKIETEFGEKTQIHASSCNQDYSCLGGDCPSFVTVQTRPGSGYRKRQPPKLEPDEIPEPPGRVPLDEPYRIYIPGVGGTGVITINALLCYAALIDGKRVMSYDQTGAAQKWGPVLSSLVIAAPDQPLAANKVGAGKADLYLAFDLMAGANKVNLDRCDPPRTTAVINTTVLPSGEMIRDVHFKAPTDAMRQAIERFTNAARNVSVEARRQAEALFGDYMATNMFALGVAYQSGLLPLEAGSIEGAIRLNGVQVEQNLQAFRYGRLQVADPERVRALVEPPPRGFEEERAAAVARLPGKDARAYESLLERCAPLDDEARRLLAVRLAELIEYEDAGYAEHYLDFVLKVAEREQAAIGAASELTRAVIRYLYKLMAYKDEYEVARLHLKPAFQKSTTSLFDEPRQVIFNLHPPLLQALGLKRKLQLGPWFNPALRLLRSLKCLRGTPLDIFGYARVRREERSLIPWYRDLLESALARLTADTYAEVVELARLPDEIRGYEEIKLNNVALVRQRSAELLERLAQPRGSRLIDLEVG
jgi:indolepyruvate ferredoxin oxidoreductase